MYEFDILYDLCLLNDDFGGVYIRDTIINHTMDFIVLVNYMMFFKKYFTVIFVFITKTKFLKSQVGFLLWK